MLQDGCLPTAAAAPHAAAGTHIHFRTPVSQVGMALDGSVHESRRIVSQAEVLLWTWGIADCWRRRTSGGGRTAQILVQQHSDPLFRL